jgi:hypothetical protein
MFFPINEANRKNLLRILHALQDTSMGTLWWVADDLWETHTNTFRRPRLERENPHHPGVSLRLEDGEGLGFDPVPLLFGASGNQGPVVIQGLSKHEPEKPSSFGRIVVPGLFNAEPFLKRRGGPKPGIVPVKHKPRADEKEHEALRTFALQHGLLAHTDTCHGGENP